MKSKHIKTKEGEQRKSEAENYGKEPRWMPLDPMTGGVVLQLPTQIPGGGDGRATFMAGNN